MWQRNKECGGQTYTDILPSTNTHTNTQAGQTYNAGVGYINQMAVAGMKQLTSKASLSVCVWVCV